MPFNMSISCQKELTTSPPRQSGFPELQRTQRQRKLSTALYQTTTALYETKHGTKYR